MNDEVPDEFGDITPDDFIRGTGRGNPPGWMGPGQIDDIRRKMPIAYVECVPVRLDDLGRVNQVGILMRVGADGAVEKTLPAGRVLFHESLREAIARNIAKDLGDLALPLLPVSLQPFTIAEFFPTPGVSEFYDARQHAIAMCYVVPIGGDCKPQDNALDMEWVSPADAVAPDALAQMPDGHGLILRQGLAWAGAI